VAAAEAVRVDRRALKEGGEGKFKQGVSLKQILPCRSERQAQQ